MINIGEIKVVHKQLDDFYKAFVLLENMVNKTFVKYNKNFKKVQAAEEMTRRDLIFQETKINQINVRCMCGVVREESLEYVTPPMTSYRTFLVLDTNIPIPIRDVILVCVRWLFFW